MSVTIIIAVNSNMEYHVTSDLVEKKILKEYNTK